MAKRILLVWELGGGAGHLLRLGWIAKALGERGYDPIFALPHTEALAVIEEPLQGRTRLDAPVWPHRPSQPPDSNRRRVATMGDILVKGGLHSAESIDALFVAADRLIASADPHAIVADYAPASLLTARGRIPSIAVGNAFTLPPWQTAQFNNLDHLGRAPIFDEAETLTLVNEWLTPVGRRPLQHLPEIFYADRTCVGTFSELDPYADARSVPPVPPWLPSWEQGGTQKRDEIFCYLSAGSDFQSTVLLALADVARTTPVRLHARHLAREAVELLTAAAITVETELIPFEQIQARSRLIVSLGSFGLVSCALAAGIPQIVLPPNLAMDVTGRAVEALGVGRCLRLQPRNPLERALLAQVIAEAFGSAALRETAERLASGFARRLDTRPEDVVANLIEELVGPA